MSTAVPEPPSAHPAQPVQRVSGSTVHRDLVQIAQVSGDVTITQAVPASGPPEPRQVVEGDIPAPPVGFQLREDLLERLHTQVVARGAAVVRALTGTPGVGKTLLAASYAWECQHARWPVVAWISAETEEQILAGLDNLARRLDIRTASDDTAIAAGRAKAWLSETDRPCLVVFDNAADIAAVRRWCPSTGAARVIVTSRNRAFGRHYPPVEVEVFTPAQAVAFLAERTGLPDDGAAELAEELGRLPLALAQAAAVIAWQRTGYRAYLESLRELPLKEYLAPLEGDAYSVGTAQAILLSIAQAEEATPDARMMLEVLAVLSPAGTSRPLLRAALAPERLDTLLARLSDTSLIAFNEDGSAVLMHRLIQRVLRERAHRQDRLPQILSQAVGLLRAFDALIPEGTAVWDARAKVETLFEHTDALYAVARPTGLLSPGLLNLSERCAQHLIGLAELPRTISLLQKMVADSEHLLGTDHPHTLAGRHNLVRTYQEAGRPQEAIALYERVLADTERAEGPDHLKTLTSRNNLANAYQETGRPQEAITLHEQVLATRERVLGPDHPHSLRSRNNLAGAYQEAGRLPEAIALLQRVLTDAERVLGPDHSDALINGNNLATAYQKAGRLQEAIALLQRVLTDAERVLGPDHPQTLTSGNNLANAYQEAGRLPEAVTLHEQVLAAHERVLDPDHPNILRSRHNLAYVYQRAGRLREAITLYEQVLAHCERILDADHLLTRTVRVNLASARAAVRPRHS